MTPAVLIIAGVLLLVVPAAISISASYFSRQAKRPAEERKK